MTAPQASEAGNKLAANAMVKTEKAAAAASSMFAPGLLAPRMVRGHRLIRRHLLTLHRAPKSMHSEIMS